jgi:eukaryotic-like serine/threonine-protein kinase
MDLKDRTVFGKYRVLARLGRGGMGDVFLAVNLGPAGVSKLIVVKELREQLAALPEARSMFLDEARIASRLNHPNVVQTFEVVEEGEALYLTMEFLEGQPLQSMIRGPKRELVPLGAQLHILADTLAALHYAHELTDYDGTPLAVVHRDVSPHNIIVTYEGATKLVDFGIAKASDAQTVTESGVFKGKVRFSSPEQVVAGAVDRRSDVFAAGAVLWEIVTGEQLWKGVPDTKVLVDLAAGRIPTPRSVQPTVPEKLDAICAKAMAAAPGDRYATAHDFREALLEYMREAREPEVALGPVVSAAFRSDRREMRSIIDAEIKALRDTPSGAFRERRVPVLSVPPPTSDSRGTGLAHAKPYDVAPRGKVVVPLALLVCCALAMALYASFPNKPRASFPPAGRANDTTEPSPASLAHVVHLHLSARPTTARIAIDGISIVANPYEVNIPPDAAGHDITITADGFEPRTLKTSFDRDVLLDVALAPLAPSAAPAAPAKPRPVDLPAAPANGGPAHAAPARTSKPQRAIEEEDPYQR